MTLETDLHALRPALDRRIADATLTNGIAPPASAGGSRARLAIMAFAAVALIAVAVGLGARVTSDHRHGNKISPPPETTASTTPPTTTSAPTPSTTATPASVPIESVEWAAVDYPIARQCGTVFTPPVTVGHVAYSEPAAGVRLAIVEVSCTHGAGTPPVALYVYDGATSATTPHLSATLLSPVDGWQASAFTVAGTTLTVPAFGFSSTSIPNCCPDVRTTLTWHWTGGRYELSGSVPPHVPGPTGGGS